MVGFDHPLRKKISPNWAITKPTIGADFYTAEQRVLIDKVVRGYFPEDYQRKFLHRGPFNRLARGDAWNLVQMHGHDQRISKSEGSAAC